MSDSQYQIQKQTFALLQQHASTAIRFLSEHQFPSLEAPNGSISLSCRPKGSPWNTPFDLPPLKQEEKEDLTYWEWTQADEIRIDLLEPIDNICCDPVIWFAATQGSEFSDQHVEQLLNAPLCGAEIDWSNITEAGLSKLATISSLQFLDISWTKLSASSLLPIAKLSQIRCLKLNAHHITPDVIAMLNTLPIEALHLNQCRVQALAQLCIPKLRELWLWDSNISDADLKCIENCPQIERLELRGTGIQGVRLHPLRSSTNLRILNLSATNLHNNALSCFHDIPSLEYLDISHTNVDKWHIQNFTENRSGFNLPPIHIQAT